MHIHLRISPLFSALLLYSALLWPRVTHRVSACIRTDLRIHIRIRVYARARARVYRIYREEGGGGGEGSCTHVPRTRRFGDNRLYCRTRTIGSDLDECCEIVRTRRVKEKETDIRMKGSVEQFQICFRHELVFRLASY